MRNLTIKRTKSHVACLAKMKVYIEDPTSSELVINDVPCRKIGDLKNGEEKTFVIGEQAAKIFVIGDTLSRNFCNEFYDLPEGGEDIFLSGKNHYNPAGGNPFRFDHNENEEVLENRRKGTRRGIVILCISGVIGLVIGFLISYFLIINNDPDPKTFSDSGLSITLTEDFETYDIEEYTVAYSSPDVAVFLLKEEFSLAEGFGDYTLNQYGNLLIQVNGQSDSELKTAGGLTYFEYEYTNPDSNQLYHYITYVFKSSDAFWMVQFATLDSDLEEYEPLITEWASSVSFSN